MAGRRDYRFACPGATESFGRICFRRKCNICSFTHHDPALFGPPRPDSLCLRGQGVLRLDLPAGSGIPGDQPNKRNCRHIPSIDGEKSKRIPPLSLDGGGQGEGVICLERISLRCRIFDRGSNLPDSFLYFLSLACHKFLSALLYRIFLDEGIPCGALGFRALGAHADWISPSRIFSAPLLVPFSLPGRKSLRFIQQD